MINYILGIPVNIQLYKGVDDAITSTFLHDELHGETLIIGDIKLDEDGQVSYRAYFYDKDYTESNHMIERNQELIDATITHILDYVFMEK